MARRQTRTTRTAAIRDSFWLIPACFTTGSLLLAVGLSVLELRLVLPLGNILPSGPAGARALLSSIITAMISFTALVFSITVVALQLAASQYSPRILRTFLEDRVIQTALGLFMATFLFAMIVLAALPDQPQPRVPEVSLAVGLLLVLASSAVFVWYLHHVTTIMRVSHIIAAIGAQTRHSIDVHRPNNEMDATVPQGPPVQVVPADSSGMITDVDVDRLARTAVRHHCLIVVLATPGDFVTAGQPVLETHPVGGATPQPLPPGVAAKAVSIGPERSPGQDIGFGFRQLADIAERALSPGINDITTAVRAIQESHDLLRRLATRPNRATAVVDDEGQLRAVAPRQSFESFLAIAIDDVAHAGHNQPRIQSLLGRILLDIADIAIDQHRSPVDRRRGLICPDQTPSSGG